MAPGVERLFSLDGRVAVVTGATGVLGGAMARGLARAGAKVAILGRREQRAREVAFGIEKEGGEAIPLPADVLDGSSLERAREEVLREWGRVDILVNAAGGNAPEAITSPRKSFFEVEKAAIEQVVDLNLMGTILPSKVFGEAMTRAEEPEGSIVNVSSMAAQRPLSGVVAYAAAKAAVENFTRWLAVELARAYGEGLRVNAIAPGFFVGEQNRRLLLDEEGNLTARGEKIIEHTPAGRFGEPEDLVGAVVWLCGHSARFVSGAVIPVDGGFGAFAGV
ncbi:SDR family oxidoreductase [Rubrobacter naiadicus]|uniref:SDR family oxidoreductase n=1 Tax=Rubrobacter naiadicus TaxID=1392641 RepID=UPI002362E8FB|nr:SDR family oxidoreductase [Rubrobacter naiadicus]